MKTLMFQLVLACSLLSLSAFCFDETQSPEAMLQESIRLAEEGILLIDSLIVTENAEVLANHLGKPGLRRFIRQKYGLINTLFGTYVALGSMGPGWKIALGAWFGSQVLWSGYKYWDFRKRRNQLAEHYVRLEKKKSERMLTEAVRDTIQKLENEDPRFKKELDKARCNPSLYMLNRPSDPLTW